MTMTTFLFLIISFLNLSSGMAGQPWISSTCVYFAKLGIFGTEQHGKHPKRFCNGSCFHHLCWTTYPLNRLGQLTHICRLFSAKPLLEIIPALLALCAGNSPVTGEFPAQRPVTRSVDFFFICAWINGWVNTREAGDLRRHRAQYDAIVMIDCPITIIVALCGSLCLL